MKKLRTIEMERLTLDEFHQAKKLPLIVVLDDVRSMHNVGSVFRTSDAFRLEAVYLCGITSTPPSAEINKTALGAEDSVTWRYFTSASSEKYAVVLGNEVKGVHQEVVDASDGCLEIPQFGTKHSMNVSVTAGIIIWHFAKPLLITCG